MSVSSAPPIDPRSGADVAKQLRDLLHHYADCAPDGVSAGLIGVSARLAELLIQRLNQVPQKNLLAFLNLLGAALQPPQPARAPLTFVLSKGSVVDALVPAKTQVAAPPGVGERDPVVYETENEMFATSAQLAFAMARDPNDDTWADYSNDIIVSGGSKPAVFHGNQRILHALYLGQSQFPDFQDNGKLSLEVFLDVRAAPQDDFALRWEIFSECGWREITPAENGDGTQGLRHRGVITFDSLPRARTMAVANMSKQWIRCRLLTPITRSPVRRSGMVRAGHLPNIASVKMQLSLPAAGLPIDPAAGLPIDEAYSSAAGAIDLTTAFKPFDRPKVAEYKPQVGDTLWLASREAFSKAEASVTLTFKVVSPGSKSNSLKLRWEAWNGSWTELGTSPTQDGQHSNVVGFEDGTNAFANDGDVKFVLPSGVASTAVNGIESFWIRVRIFSGNYSTGPSLNSPTLTYKIEDGSVVVENDGVLTDVTALNRAADRTFFPFQPSADLCPTLYLGFTLPTGRTNFPNNTITMFFSAAALKFGEKTIPEGASDAAILQLESPGHPLASADIITFCDAEPAQTEQLQLAWEYWNGEAWAKLLVRDQTDNLTSSGTIEFLAPPDFAPHAEFGACAWWLRVRWVAGDYDTDPRIDRVLLNTTMAMQAVTVAGEVLGSSDGSPNQRFRTKRAPVLAGQRLAVREPEKPTGDDLKAIFEDAGPEALLLVPESAGRPSEIWVTWLEATDFYASDSRSRHYTLDRVTGQVAFGDGRSGMIPPAGAGNIRMTSYRTGGGARGNRPAGSIVQLKTAIPYINGVSNIIDASGGADAETMESFLARAPVGIRHRGRAVTVEDYQDLAHEAASDVARALCVPNSDLAAEPLVKDPQLLGKVSVVIVPNSLDPQPRPSVELVRRVQKFLSAASPATATVTVVGPLYLRVDVLVEIGLSSLDGAGTVVSKVQDALSAFLHPLTGGSDGKGWAFGREPHRSDLYRVVMQVPEVDHIRAFTVRTTEDLKGTRDTGRFLVHSGNHDVSLVFDS